MSASTEILASTDRSVLEALLKEWRWTLDLRRGYLTEAETIVALIRARLEELDA